MSSNNEAIKVFALNKSFGKNIILDNLSFSIPRNSIAGFLGPNGAGKTTTLRMLMGLLPLGKGDVELLGYKLPGERTKALENIGAVVENPTFIETMSAFENLHWFGSLYKDVSFNRINEVIELVGLKEATNQKFGTFSSGMKQRLGVAFGILHSPELLILDEPTSGMDPVGRVQMREILLRIHETQKTTIFLSSHLLDEIQKLCNYVVIISKGRTLREGYVDDILASQQEKYEIRVPDEFVEKTKQVIGSMMFMVKSFELSPRGMILTVENGSGAAINETLVKAGIPVSALIPVECSLEEAFISLTNDKNSAFLKKEPSYTVRDLSISNTPEKTQIPEQTQTLEMPQIQTLEQSQTPEQLKADEVPVSNLFMTDETEENKEGEQQ